MAKGLLRGRSPPDGPAVAQQASSHLFMLCKVMVSSDIRKPAEEHRSDTAGVKCS